MLWNILAVEDDREFATRVETLLRPALNGRAEIVPAADLTGARDQLKARPVHLVLLDMVFPLVRGGRPESRAGLKLLSELPGLAPGALVIVLSGQDPQDAVELLLSRRVDAYVFKDTGLAEVKVQVERCLETLELRRARHLLREGVDRSRPPAMVAVGAAMKALLARAEQVAIRDTSVLVTGESGTGKEVLAKYIHAVSPRRLGPFVALSCAAIPESLAEAELFGAVKGAYTGIDADREGVMGLARGGTLFLDEIGELPLTLQAKLLRALQDRTYRPLGSALELPADFRLMCATHRDLEQAVDHGQFRADLLYRILVFPLHLPPLRERTEDLPQLVDHLVARFNQEMGRRIRGASQEALGCLSAHSWPGNVRELANAIEYAYVVETSEWLQPGSLPAFRRTERKGGDVPASLGYGEALEGFERSYLERALAQFGGHVGRTAQSIGIPRRTLQDRLTRLGIKPGPEPPPKETA